MNDIQIAEKVAEDVIKIEQSPGGQAAKKTCLSFIKQMIKK